MAGDPRQQLIKYLRDAYAMEQQSQKMLQAALHVAGDPDISQTYRGHLGETEQHIDLVGERLGAYGESPSTLKDLAAKVGALGLGGALVASPDTPAKLAAVAYGYENLEVAAYELLRRLAQHAGDEETVAMADRILAQERSAVEKVSWSFDRVVELSIEQEASATHG
jgi:ferritin-like metal-binding protein YciE